MIGVGSAAAAASEAWRAGLTTAPPRSTRSTLGSSHGPVTRNSRVLASAIGLGTFLAQYFLRKPLMAASTREFRVTGPWDDPKVERVERSLLGETAADATPAPEPASAVPR